MRTRLRAAMEWVRTKLFRDERELGLAGYGCIIALVAILSIAGFLALSGRLSEMFADPSTGLQSQVRQGSGS